jgi:hypothetical protein
MNVFAWSIFPMYWFHPCSFWSGNFQMSQKCRSRNQQKLDIEIKFKRIVRIKLPFTSEKRKWFWIESTVNKQS